MIPHPSEWLVFDDPVLENLIRTAYQQEIASISRKRVK
jgi:hypothetical protein